MDLQQLKYFLAVAETGNFSQAARRCGIAQPSLSQQMQKLEKELGQPLFDRLPRGVVLTEAGHRLTEHARDLLHAAEDAEKHVRELGGQMTGRLNVGAIPTIAPYLLPGVVQKFSRKYPDVQLSLSEDTTDRLLDQLEAGRIDIATASLPIDRPHLHVQTLFEEPLLLCMPADHKLAKRKKVAWSDVADERFMVLHEMHCMGEQVMQFCQSQGAKPHIVLRGSQIATIQQLVGQGLGLSFVAEMASMADKSKRRVYKELSDQTPTRAITLIWHLHRYRTNAAKALMKMLTG